MVLYPNKFDAAVYWPARQESIDACTTRAEAFFRCLATCDPELSHWFKLGRSRHEALMHPVTTDVATLRKLLLAGRARTDGTREIMEDLGSSLYLWNGAHDDEAMGLDIRCGHYSPFNGFNSCKVTLSREGPTSERLLTTPVITKLLTCMIDAWDPDFGLICSDAYSDLRPDMMDYVPRIGWLIYVSNRLGRAPPVPAPATVTQLAQGFLITVTQERFDVRNPAHLEVADRVAAALDAAKIRKPIR